MVNNNTRGSEWNKWDLHIHTPFTGKNDQFTGSSKDEKWDNYLTKIEQNNDVKVLGITDYFSIDNYLYMLELQKNGRIPNVYLIPNVELRILPVTRTETPINIHVLFDPELNIDIIQRDFFNQLQFEYSGSKFQCNRYSLIQLGKAINTNSVSDEEAYKTGLNQFNITFPDLRNVLKAKSLEGHYIVGVANSNNDGNSGIQDSSLSATRKEIYRLSNFIFSANKNDINFFLGKGSLTKDQLINEYGSIKPCVRGCDAHDLNKMFRFDDNRYTWIKALPTFNGLKQILYEPEDRVCICEQKPEEKADYQIIDSIIFNNSEMNHQEIMFNQNLNTIIGGRSSGKSILLGCLASAIDPKIEPKDNDEFKKYNKHIKELNEGVSIKWRDNTDEYRKIIYYSQSAISEKVREDEYGISGISELVEEIVKKETDKFELLKNYDNFVTVNKSEINTKINEFCQYKNQIEDINKQIENIGNRTGIETEIQKIQKDIESIKKGLSNYLSPEEDEIYSGFKDQLEKHSVSKEIYVSDSTQLQLLKGYQLFAPIDTVLSKFSNDSYKRIQEFYTNLQKNVNNQWNQFIDSEIQEREACIESENSQINYITDSEIYKRGEKFQEDNTIIKAKSEKLQEETNKKNLIIKLEEERKKLIIAKEECSKDIWIKFLRFKQESEKLSEQLSTEREEVKIQAISTYTFKPFFDKALSLLDKRNSEIKKYDNYDDFKIPDLEKAMKDFYDGIISDKYALVKTNYQQALIDLYSNNYYKISYDVNYDGDKFSKMSEGKKAFIALRLLLDFDDSLCPIIIDQPEDDLDNRAIYDQLVTYLRKQKKHRQIILATHNPNVVVGADAELVIVANQNGDSSPNQDGVKFEYYANAIEDSFTDDSIKTTLLQKGIREHICEILEGGNTAFEIREKKYGYK